MADTAADLAVVDKYIDEITVFINSIICEEKQSILIACKVFLAHKEKNNTKPFKDEGRRKMWLYLKARNLARDYMHKQALANVQA